MKTCTQLQQLLCMLNGPAGDISQSGCAALSGEENFQSMLYPTSAAAGITISAGRTRVNGCEWESSCWVVEGSCLVCYFYLQACSSKKSKAGGE